MKKQILTLLLITTFIYANAQSVNIPDPNFKSYLVALTALNTNGDSTIQTSEASSYTGKINTGATAINDLRGIEAFENIIELTVTAGTFTSIDLTKNTKLNKLTLRNSQITSLDLSTNTILETVNCTSNPLLASLEVSNCTDLRLLICGGNNLSSLTLPQSTTLTRVDCFANKLTSLDMTPAPNLTDLTCYDNQMTSINLSGNSKLTYLNTGQNPFESIDLSALDDLDFFNCYDCGLDDIDLTSNTAITSLSLNSNNFTSIDLSKNKNLKTFNCQSGKLTSIDLSEVTSLVSVNCASNELKFIDVSMLPHLISLNISSNPMESINVANGNNTNFTTFRAVGCPNLSCVQVDDTAYSQANWDAINASITSFKIECQAPSLGIENITYRSNIYPNPATNKLNIATDDLPKYMEIYASNGQSVLKTRFQNSIDVSSLTKGLYIFKLDFEHGSTFTKFQKQ